MDIPVIKVEGKGIAEVWEKSILELWEKGAQIKTEYDNPKDPPSRDGTMINAGKGTFCRTENPSCFSRRYGGFGEVSAGGDSRHS